MVNGIQEGGSISNLTVEGLDMSEGVSLLDPTNNVTFKYLTMENWGSPSNDAQNDAAFGIYTGDATRDTADSNLNILYNQMDNIPQCLETGEGGITFAHNVCGPGIGHNDPNDVHYLQTEGAAGIRVDNNAFLGPPAPIGSSHLNVMHAWGADMHFDNNIVYRTDSAAEAVLWGDDGPISDGTANNNLVIEDPANQSQGGDTYSIFFDNGTNMTMSNNTVINPTDYTALLSQYSTGFVAHYNLLDATTGCGGDFGSGTSNNASNDNSCDVRWTPAWQDTTWTPNDGSPWVAPPADYYKPVGISSAYGYQGQVGP